MIQDIFIVIFLLLAVLLISTAISVIRERKREGNTSKEDDPTMMMSWGIIFAILCLAFASFGSLYSISTDNTVAITRHDKVVRVEREAGTHVKFPHEVASSINTGLDSYKYTRESPVTSMMKGGKDTRVWLTVQWRINPDAVAKVYDLYGSHSGISRPEEDLNDKFRTYVIEPAVQKATQMVMDKEDVKPAEMAQKITALAVQEMPVDDEGNPLAIEVNVPEGSVSVGSE